MHSSAAHGLLAAHLVQAVLLFLCLALTGACGWLAQSLLMRICRQARALATLMVVSDGDSGFPHEPSERVRNRVALLVGGMGSGPHRCVEQL